LDSRSNIREVEAVGKQSREERGQEEKLQMMMH